MPETKVNTCTIWAYDYKWLLHYIKAIITGTLIVPMA